VFQKIDSSAHRGLCPCAPALGLRGLLAPEIYKYIDFPGGGIPKVLAQETAGAKYVLDAPPEVLRLVEIGRTLKYCRVVWIAKYNEKAKRIEPNGVALLLVKALTVPGGGECKLE